MNLFKYTTFILLAEFHLITASFGYVLYDSDQSLNDLFEDENVCKGLHTGVVKEDLGEDYKPVFSGSENAVKCFQSKEKFTSLFHYTKDVNVALCAQKGILDYENFYYYVLDSTVSSIFGYNDTLMMIYEGCEDCKISSAFRDVKEFYYSLPIADYCQENHQKELYPLDDYTDAFSYIDEIYPLYSNGWSDSAQDTLASTKMAQTKYEIDNGHHNSQFCAEAHVRFTYRDTSYLYLSTSGETWLFIDKKLVVDLGGAALDTTMRIQLSDLKKKYGEGFLKEGEVFQLALFYCNRGVNSSRLFFDGNIEFFYVDENAADTNYIENPYCSRIISGDLYKEVIPESMYMKIIYTLETADGTHVSDLKSGEINYGGIDLTQKATPKIDSSKVEGLDPGDYRLVATIYGSPDHPVYIKFTVPDKSPIRKNIVVSAGVDYTVNGRDLSLRATAPAKFSLFDMQGRVIAQGRVAAGDEQHLKVQNPGSYLLRAGNETKRIVIR